LIRNGTPRNGPSGSPAAIAARARLHQVNHGVDPRIDRRRARQRRIQQLVRAHLVQAHELGEPERVVADVFFEGHAGEAPSATEWAPLEGRRILAAGIVDTGKRVQNDALQQ
jgi:hypothetical protein